MTISEKRDRVRDYCDSMADCTDCVFDGYATAWCKIGNAINIPEEEIDEVLAMIEDSDDECHCDECAYFDTDENTAPCINCKYGIPHNDPRYATAPLLWSKTKEAVNHPSHYNQGGIECIDAMVAAFGKEAVENFCLCNAFKYVWRNRDKNGSEDIDKAIWYLNKIKELCSDE